MDLKPYYWIFGAIILLILMAIRGTPINLFSILVAFAIAAAISLFLEWIKPKFSKREE